MTNKADKLKKPTIKEQQDEFNKKQTNSLKNPKTKIGDDLSSVFGHKINLDDEKSKNDTNNKSEVYKKLNAPLEKQKTQTKDIKKANAKRINRLDFLTPKGLRNEKYNTNNRNKNMVSRGIGAFSKQVTKKANKKIKKISMMIGLVFLPIMLLFILAGLALTVVTTNTMQNQAALIATLASPKYRAELKARNLLGDEKITSIPDNMIGPEGDLQGSGKAGSGKKSSSGNDRDVSGPQGTIEQRAKLVYKFFKGKLSNARIAGILGNWEVESGIAGKRFEGDYTDSGSVYGYGKALKNEFDPDKIFGGLGVLYPGGVNTPAYYDPVAKHSFLGVGLGQWTGPRAGNLMRKAKKTMKIYDIGFQLKFMNSEKARGWTGDNSWSGWSAASKNDPGQATKDFAMHWEGNPDDKYGPRIAAAKKWFAQMKKW